ncbi:acetolactate synthase 2 small subunit [Serratia microhaemolytica]|uniref:acetolactate synthase 2 small subunit n=1 Tax=Serratia microhaemolytica TaxID=2675110 RepID=UPI000FDEB3C4|nr:acetolactate synthase 2 small subunit [Serratia microhaemolytica]
MMQHQLLISARSRPEMLERILRVVRHRGFQVCAMDMVLGEGNEATIKLTVASARSVDLLSAQLTKLVDVCQVELQQAISQQIRA